MIAIAVLTYSLLAVLGISILWTATSTTKMIVNDLRKGKVAL